MRKRRLHGLVVALALAASMTPAEGKAQGTLDVPVSFQWYYSFAPAGWRYWYRTPTGWVERYPDGRENRFQSLGTIQVAEGCSAALARKLPGETGEPPTEVAIPTRGCDRHVLVFRFVGPPVSDWQRVGDMQAIMY